MTTDINWTHLKPAEKFQLIKTNPLLVSPKARVISKDTGYAFWHILDVIWKILTFGKGTFMNRATAIGPYIAFPLGWKEEEADDYDCATLIHEADHLKQRLALGGKKFVWLGTLIFLIMYLFLPVPIFFAYFRYRWEREAYLAQWKAVGRYSLNVEYDLRKFVANLTGRPYFWAWFNKRSVQTWFLKNCFSGMHQ